MGSLRPHLKYLKVVLTHKWYVFVYGRQLGVPLWRLIIHDWTKFTPAEWPAYVDRFASGRAGKEDKSGDTFAFGQAWLHHWMHNPHHWEFWCHQIQELDPHQIAFRVEQIEPIEMPETYVREMVADWKAANKVYADGKTLIPWYEAHASRQVMHPNTRKLVEFFLGYGGMGQ